MDAGPGPLVTLGRVATKTRDTFRQEMPEPLRRDVRLLGAMLGDSLVEYGGTGLLDDVERLRRAVIAARRGETGIEEVAALVDGWSLERAGQVARAFTVYFHLTNLAEEHHRIRTLRERDTGDTVPGSAAAAIEEIRASGDGRSTRSSRAWSSAPSSPPTRPRRAAAPSSPPSSGSATCWPG